MPAPIDTAARLSELDQHERSEAYGNKTKRPPHIPRRIVNSVGDLVDFASAPDKQSEFGIFIGSRLRPRNDLTFGGTGTGWTMDPSVTMPDVVAEALSNGSALLKWATVGNFPGKLRAPLPAFDDLANEAPCLAPLQAAPFADMAFSSTLLDARRFSSGVPVSRQLLDDYPYALATVIKALTGRNARGLDAYLVNGATGLVGPGPEGLLNGATPITSVSPTVITLADLYAMVAAVAGPHRESAKCAWVCHSAVDLALMQLADSSGRPVWNASGLSRWPRVVCDHFPSTVAAGTTPLVFGNLEMLHVALFGVLNVQRMTERVGDTVGSRVVGANEDVFLATNFADAAVVDPASNAIAKLVMHA